MPVSDGLLVTEVPASISPMAIDFDSDRWQRVRTNCELWWSGKLARPLIQVAGEGRDPGRDQCKIARESFLPSYGLDVPAEVVIDRLDYDLSCLEFPGDAFPHVFTNFGAGVAAAFLGARLETRSNTVWFRADCKSQIQDLRLEYDPSEAWLLRVKDICRAGVERWKGLVQMSMTDLGGTLDILSTFRPGEQLLLDLYDHEEQVEGLIWDIHDLWFRYFDDIDAVLQPANPGWSAWPGFFSTEPHYMLQCDFAYMISPEMFDRFVRPELAACCKRLANPFYHLDGEGQLAHLDSLLTINELKGVQWVPGAGAPDCRHWPEVYRKIRAAGKLIQIWPGDDLDYLDVIAEQIGSAEGIVVVGQVPADKRDKLLHLLDRYGAA